VLFGLLSLPGRRFVLCRGVFSTCLAWPWPEGDWESESTVVGPPKDDRPPLAEAMEWVSRITTVVLEMVLPGLAGQWLDQRWGTNFLALLGFAVGLPLGFWHLLIMTRKNHGDSK